MSISTAKILEIGDWLLEEALAERSIEATLEALVHRLRKVGIPIDRCRLSWPTLHPLFEAETVVWKEDEGLSSQRFDHQDRDSDEWRRSPVKWMLDHDERFLRSRLERDAGDLQFPLFEELRLQGYRDLIALRTPMFTDASLLRRDDQDFGLYVTWATKAPGGFHDTVVDTLRSLQRYMALLCKLMIYPRLISNVADTYLGPTIAREVLGGRIRLGSGSHVRALVWYSDLRNSTGLAEELGEESYLALLNDYFACTGRSVVEAGGEILAFIGDAVMAIFPMDEAAGATGEVARRAVSAAAAAVAAGHAVNLRRAGEGAVPIDFGIAMCVGDVRLGNIGIPQRLSFSVVGPSANEVERIERMTKELGVPVLATQEVIAHAAADWRCLGSYPLRGMREPVALYGLAVPAAIASAA
ncbi:adenylate/guanylate cyclase domain-containing protein [Aureimonas sp. AU12]|uniref:adenylate/guanylate cyclase domain-containing protein n=1 Tax=Aureimonas sp. AU12 TaxID=1638161 RepID=UPI000785B5D1|nr:adenylate/guanylate cyclase domain-containing protein [Aureimonas sp. AU12]